MEIILINSLKTENGKERKILEEIKETWVGTKKNGINESWRIGKIFINQVIRRIWKHI